MALHLRGPAHPAVVVTPGTPSFSLKRNWFHMARCVSHPQISTTHPPWADEHVTGRSSEPQRSDSDIIIVSVPRHCPIVEGRYIYI